MNFLDSSSEKTGDSRGRTQVGNDFGHHQASRGERGRAYEFVIRTLQEAAARMTRLVIGTERVISPAAYALRVQGGQPQTERRRYG